MNPPPPAHDPAARREARPRAEPGDSGPPSDRAAGPRDPRMTPGETSERTRPGSHWPALDGMRAIAVMAVVAEHAYVLPGGYLGVDIFFVLSGFLITTLLIDERRRRGGRISFRNFYMRRVLRLFPALGCVIVASALLAAVLEATGTPYGRVYGAATIDAIPAVVLFAGNWVRALDHSSFLSSLGLLGHTWSLAVEEQFYLLWPALFAFIMRFRLNRKHLAAVLTLIAVAEMVYRGVAGHAGYGSNSVYDRLYFGAGTHSDGLLIGCALAFWLDSAPSAVMGRLGRTLLRSMTAVAATLLLLLFVIGGWGGLPVEISLAVLASAVIVAGVVTGQAPSLVHRLLTSRRAVLIGRRSYGLYLWQYVLITAAQLLCAPYTGTFPVAQGSRRIVFSLAIAVAVAASLAVANVSYRYIELPALRLKRRFGAAGAPATRPPVAAELRS